MNHIMKNTLLTVIISALVAIGAFFAVSGTQTTEQLGASVGPEHFSTEFFYGGIVEGSNCYSTTTTGTMIPGVLSNNSCIVVASGGAGQAVLSLTLPASTTMNSVLPNKGSCRSWFIDTTAVAAATTTTIVAGTGWNLVGLDATGAGTGADVIDGNEYGRLTACRETDGDITGFVTEWIHAD